MYLGKVVIQAKRAFKTFNRVKVGTSNNDVIRKIERNVPHH